jgi:hypothetical protein
VSDITYVIGAKDSATPTFKRVESSMERLESSTKRLGESSEKSLTKMAIGIGTLTKASIVLFALEKAAQGVAKAFEFVAGGATDFRDAEASISALKTAVDLNGGATAELVQQHLKFADALEKSINVSAEQTQSLMTTAATLGVSNDALDETATAAIGLSKAMGISLEDALKKTIQATEGNFGAFAEFIPKINDVATSQEKLAMVQELASRGMGLQQAAANSSSGAIARLQTKLGELAESFGSALQPSIDTASSSLSGLIDALIEGFAPAMQGASGAVGTMQPIIQALIDHMTRMVKTFTTAFGVIRDVFSDAFGNTIGSAQAKFASFAEWIEWGSIKMSQGVIAAVTAFELAYTNLADVVGVAVNYVLLQFETMRADMEHLFTSTLPTYAMWFGTNFYRIIETAFNAVSTVVSNSIQNITEQFSVLWDFIKSGGDTATLAKLGEIAGRGYLDGFESTIAEMPNILARGLTGREQELQGKVNATGESLASQFMEKFNARAIKLGEKAGTDLSTAIDLQLKSKGMDAAAGKLASAGGLGASNPLVSGSGELSAVESRLLTRGPVRRLDPMAKVGEEVIRLTGVAEASLSELKNIRANLDGEGIKVVDAA